MSYRIKDVANHFGITTNKLRYYEKRGLIQPSRDEENGYRVYTEEDMVKIHAILMYRALDLPIEEVTQIIADSSGVGILDILHTQWKAINEEMDRLRGLKDSIEQVMDVFYEKDQDAGVIKLIESGKRISEIRRIKDQWRDRWNFDSWSKHYDEDVRRGISAIGFYTHYDDLLDKVFELGHRGQHDKGYKVLDIGVGTGNLARRFLGKADEVIGIDQSREMLHVAKEKYPQLKVRLGEFLKIPYESHCFDVIVSTYAFHHLNEEEKVLAINEMIRVLKPQGRIIIGDMMFASQEEKSEMMKAMTERQRFEVEDEYFAFMDMLAYEFEQQGKKCENIHIGGLLNIVVAEQKEEIAHV